MEQALALGRHRLFEHLRVGEREIRRRHRVDEGLGHEPHALARRLVEPLDRVDRAEHPVGDQQIGLPDRVEDRIVAPFGGGEAPVRIGPRRQRRFLGGVRRSGNARQRPLPDVEPLGPHLGLRLHQLGRIAEQIHPRPLHHPALGRRRRGGRRFLSRLPHLPGEMLHHHLLRAPHHPGPMLEVFERGGREGGRGRRCGIGVVGHERGSLCAGAI